MKKDEFQRNTPSGEGTRNDPNIRDESAPQPGVQTLSSSNNDDANQHLTKTASDGFSGDTEFGKNADPKFDEIGDSEEG